MTYMDDKGTRTAALSSELIGFLRDLRLAFRWKMAEQFSGMKPSSCEPSVVPLVTDPDAVKDAIAKAHESAVSIAENANCLCGALQHLAAELDDKAGDLDCRKVDCYRRESEQHLNRLGADMAALFIAKQKLFASFIFQLKCPADPCSDPAYSPDPWFMLGAQRAKADEAVKGAEPDLSANEPAKDDEAVKVAEPDPTKERQDKKAKKAS